VVLQTNISYESITHILKITINYFTKQKHLGFNEPKTLQGFTFYHLHPQYLLCDHMVCKQTLCMNQQLILSILIKIASQNKSALNSKDQKNCKD
jgi:hypothetical protein